MAQGVSERNGGVTERPILFSGPMDALAEGISIPRCGCEVCATSSRMCPADESTAIEAFGHLWDSINAKRGFGWNDNPWCWVLSFKRIYAAERAA